MAEIDKLDTAISKEKEALREKAENEKLEKVMAGHQAVLELPVVLHPTVLLSIADHYSRLALGTGRRVVGCMLGEMQGNTLHVTNTFGIPFEEEVKDRRVWYLDHCYLDKMFKMFRKINAKEQVVGWYSTGHEIKNNDIEIHECFRKYHKHPIFLLVNVDRKDCTELPIQTYYSFEQPSPDARFRRSFVHMTCGLDATEAEEVGVEHLLKDVQNAFTSTLSSQITGKTDALKMIAKLLAEFAEYLEDVAAGAIRAQPHILASFQDLLKAIPDKSSPQELKNALEAQSNDASLAIYLSFAARTTMMMHELLRNKVQIRSGDEALKN